MLLIDRAGALVLAQQVIGPIFDVKEDVSKDEGLAEGVVLEELMARFVFILGTEIRQRGSKLASCHGDMGAYLGVWFKNLMRPPLPGPLLQWRRGDSLLV